MSMIKTGPTVASTPIIFINTHPEANTAATSGNCPMFDFIAKGSTGKALTSYGNGTNQQQVVLFLLLC